MSRSPSRQTVFSYFAVLAVASLTLPAVHAVGKSACNDCGAPCREYDLTCCTVMVKKLVVQTKMETHVTKVWEDREETYTVYTKKPVTRKYTKEFCYLENDVKTTKCVEKDCHLVRVPVERTFTVKVPHTEIREVPICKPDCGCNHCTNKSLPPLTRTCEVVVEHEEQRQEVCEEVRLAIDKRSHDISYCVRVPKKKTEVCAEETTFELVPVEKTRTIQVCVPKVEKYPVEVFVCKMVPEERHCCSGCAAKHGGK